MVLINILMETVVTFGEVNDLVLKPMSFVLSLSMQQVLQSRREKESQNKYINLSLQKLV